MATKKPKSVPRLPPADEVPVNPAKAAAFVKQGGEAPAPVASPPVPADAPRGARQMVTLSSGEARRRVNFLLSPELVKQARHLAADRNLDLTQVVTVALEDYLRR